MLDCIDLSIEPQYTDGMASYLCYRRSDQPKQRTIHRPRVKRRRLGREYIQGVGANRRLRVRKKSLDVSLCWLDFGLGSKELPQQRGARPVEQTAHQTE